MAKSKTSFRVDDRDVQRVINNGIKMFKNARSFFTDIGRNEVDAARRRIRVTKQSPDGRSWAPWAPSTREQRRKKGTIAGGLLHDTGNLYQQMGYNAFAAKVEIYNRAPYATYLQHGTRNMPAREFMGWSRESIYDIKDSFRKYMKRWR